MCRFPFIHVFSAIYSFFMTKPQLFAGCQLHNILFKSSAKVTWDQVSTVPCHHGGMCWQNKARLKPWFVLCSLAITLPSLEKRYYVILTVYDLVISEILSSVNVLLPHRTFIFGKHYIFHGWINLSSWFRLVNMIKAQKLIWN